METSLTLHEAVARSLDVWHRMVASRNLQALPDILHPQAVFRSPMAFTPYQSGQAVALVLNTVIEVFEDFAYQREFASADGMSVVLEFSARIGERQLKGVDLIRFDAQGKMVEFEVMVRPLSALQALGQEMGRRLGDQLPAFKGKA